MNEQIFSLVAFTEDGIIIVYTTELHTRYADSRLKTWVRRRLRKLEEYGDVISDFKVYKGDSETSEFADCRDLEPIYLDIS